MMNKSEFKQALLSLLEQPIDGLSWEEKISFVRQTLAEADEEKSNWDQSQKGRPWTDDELRLVLRLPPTKENILRLARALHRGYGSIEQIYRWAATPQREVNKKRPDDRFIQQIKRIAKEVGWRAT